MSEATYTLVIGNKRYSSWSLRGWLLFHAFEIPVEERLVPMYTPEFEALAKEIAPARQVPTLVHQEHGARHVVWDSLAIAEYLAERHPQAGHWPAVSVARARARCLAAEMHSGFAALRREMPMNLRDALPGRGMGSGVKEDILRISSLWEDTLSRFNAGDGPYLFGAEYCVADVFFTPVALRFETYGVALDRTAAEYADALRGHPSVVAWREAAAAEPWVENRYTDNLAH